MMNHFRNILNLNDRYYFAMIDRVRMVLSPFFNSLLSFQNKVIFRKFSNEAVLSSVKDKLGSIIPEVSSDSLIDILAPEEKVKILSESEKVLNREFRIFSVEKKFNDQIDWHLDFKSGFRWPKGKLYTKYRQVELKNNADVKFPREFSRCHHFLTLGEAYLLSGDEKYTDEFKTQIRHWIKENPYKKSINWGCSMDISIRASNWIWGLRMFLNSPEIDKVFLQDIFSSLYLHGRFIFENPEKYRINNHNHFLADLAGQILISMLFEDLKFKETNFWYINGINELFKEIRLQILPSGFTYERTTNYHRLVTEFIAYTLILLKYNKRELPIDIIYRVNKMFDVVGHYLWTGGTAPIIGDQDSGRFLPFFNYDINYQRYLLNIAATLFNDGKFKAVKESNLIDVLFLFGENGPSRYKDLNTGLVKFGSSSFSDAGFYIMKNQAFDILINNSGLSHYNENNTGTHTHSDLLSFTLAYNGKPFLIDPGTYLYSSNPKERKKFRSTGMHNTITIDDFDQNELNKDDLWYIKRDAIPQEILWESNDKFDIYEGVHSGYHRLSDPVTHRRRFEFNKKNGSLRITDKLKADKDHLVKCHFHFDDKVELRVLDNNVYCKSNQEYIKIQFDLDVDFWIESKEEYISKAYNHKILAPYLVLSFKSNQFSELSTNIKKSTSNEANF